MALISCPECERQISDKAVVCPHCGYPVRELRQAPPTKVPEQPPTTPPPEKPAELEVPLALRVKWVNGIFSTTIEHKCPICGRSLRGNTDQAGQYVSCPYCKRRYRLPTAAELHESKRRKSGPPGAPYDGWSIVGFILGLTAFFLTGFEVPIVPVLAIIFSGIGLSNTAARKKKGRAFAVIGLVLGIIFLGVFALAATGVYKP